MQATYNSVIVSCSYVLSIRLTSCSLFHVVGEFYLFCKKTVIVYGKDIRDFINNYYTIRYDTIGEFNVDWKAEYSALSSTRS